MCCFSVHYFIKFSVLLDGFIACVMIEKFVKVYIGICESDQVHAMYIPFSNLERIWVMLPYRA